MRSLSILLAAALVLGAAACATRPSSSTALGNDVASACVEARARYNGYRLACVVLICPVGARAAAAALYADASAFCAADPPNSAENVAKARRFVERIQAVGRTQ